VSIFDLPITVKDKAKVEARWKAQYENATRKPAVNEVQFEYRKELKVMTASLKQETEKEIDDRAGEVRIILNQGLEKADTTLATAQAVLPATDPATIVLLQNKVKRWVQILGEDVKKKWTNDIADLSLRVTAVEEKAAEDTHRIAALEDKATNGDSNAMREIQRLNQLLRELYVTEFASAQSNELQVTKKLQAAKTAAAAANAVVAALEAERAACERKKESTQAVLDSLKAQSGATGSECSTDPPLQPSVTFNTSGRCNMARTPPACPR
jgi:hypothetical protein